MNDRLARLLAERTPSRRGIHSTGNAYDSADYYQAQFAEWTACGFSWLKLLASGDSQVETCRRLKASGSPIIPVVRFYDTHCPANVVDAGLLGPYLDAGVIIFESPFNEFYASYENSWGGSMPSDWPQQVANGWAQFAQIVLQAGGVPTTPAIESWRYSDIFVPLFDVLVKTYAGLLTQSIVAMHNRTLNHPVAYNEDPGCWLGWTWMDTWLQEALGFSLPLIGTESGPEPGWDQDSYYPKVTPDMHASMVHDILDWPTPDHYLADCFWLWEGSGAWAGASWKRNATWAGGGDLPVVQMLKDWQPEPAVDTWTEEEAPEKARTMCYDNLYPTGGIPRNDQAAFQTDGDHGAPVTLELRAGGYAMQGFALSFGYCLEGDWQHIIWLPWGGC